MSARARACACVWVWVHERACVYASVSSLHDDIRCMADRELARGTFRMSRVACRILARCVLARSTLSTPCRERGPRKVACCLWRNMWTCLDARPAVSERALTHPNLKSWDGLTEDEKKRDEAQVRSAVDIGRMLARQGFVKRAMERAAPINP